ncbi:MAG TPA: metallophosphoesterase [Actinomycetota bacterium]|nr:metallophosphoesterase [Actinomycetota bacterium]
MHEPEKTRRARLRAAPLVIFVGLVGAWLGMALFARTTVPMGPFRVEVNAAFGPGETRLGLPPFGALTADTHRSPLSLTATLQDVGVQRLTEVVNRRGIDGLVDDIERDARERLWLLAWRVIGAAAIGGGALAFLIFRTRWRRVAAATGAAVAGVALCQVFLLMTFRPAAFTEPTYSGSLALAPQFIGPAREATDQFDDVRVGLEQIVNGTVRAYTSLQAAPVGDETIRVLHISDVHASPIGMDFAREIARGFDVDLVIDTGDLTSFATPVENLILSRIPLFARPYVFVRGNHDSLSLQAEIERTGNAIVLDGEARTVEGLTIYGLGHPAFTPARGVPVDDLAFVELARGAAGIISDDLERIGDGVDILAVHDDRMAEALAGRVPVVLSGHFHSTEARRVNGTLFLRLGATGAGAGIFRGLDLPFSAEVLYFSTGEEPELIAYDVIEQDPVERTLRVQRFSVFEELEPTPTPLPATTGPTGTTSGPTAGTAATGPS